MDDQSAVVAFLSDPDSYGRRGAAVERMDTHISHIFLVGSRAYKLKRAVALPFVDFSTLALRERFCRKELEVNRRTAPELYLGLRAITREADGRLAFDGSGEALDWVVEMMRFEQAGLFDHLVAAGKLQRTQVEQLAEMVAELHRSAEITDNYGGVAGMRQVVDGNEASFRRFLFHPFAPEKIDALSRQCRDWLRRLEPLLEERRRGGKVKRCHGDLHLGNICLIDEKPVLFDAIEFNEEFACIDQGYDLAFLLMDFDRRNLGEFSALVLSRCLSASGDIEVLAALPLFLSLRAAIRAHVAAAMGNQAEARGYLARALLYLSPPPPRLVAVGGLSGSGKSRLARHLAPEIGARPGALVVRSDVLRKRLWRVAPETRLPPEAYGEDVTARVYEAMFDQAGRALAAGHAVIIDAVSARPEQRASIADLARRHGVPFTGLWLDANPGALMRRVSERRRNASDANVAVVEQQLHYELGDIDWVRIDSSGDKARTLELAEAALQ